MKRFSIFLLGVVASLTLLPRVLAQEPGLAELHYGGAQFLYFGGSGVQLTLEYDLRPNQLTWPAEQRDETAGKPVFSRQTGWGLVLRGTLRTPQAGTYQFAGTGAEGLVRLDGAWFPLAGEHTLALPQGDLRFELYQKQKDRNRNISGKLFWRPPGDAGLGPIPTVMLTHTAADIEHQEALRPDIALENPDITFATVDYRFRVPADGFYRFFLRCAGDFRWGNICPSAATVAVDDRPMLAYYESMSGRTPGFFDELAGTRYLKRGEHTIEIAGARSDRFVRHPALRLGFYRVNPRGNPDQSLAISEKNPGVTVFRKGEEFTWIFECATGEQPPAYRVQVFRQRDSNDQPVWSVEATLPKSRERAHAEVTYPCPEEGAFEYRILDAQSQLLEGPWEFVVVDPTPLPRPRLGAPAAKPAPPVLVDSIDCTEDANGEHHFRDNGTSKIVTAGKLRYRKTGTHSEYVVYENVDNKGKEFIKRPRNYKEAKGRLVGVSDQDWFAYTLKVRHPERAHLVVAWLPTDQYRRIGVQVLDPITSHYNGSTMEVEPAAGGEPVKLAFPFWPNGEAFDITTSATSARHGKPRTDSAIVRIELFEYPEGFPPLPEAAGGWNPDREAGWTGEQANLGIETRTTPRLWNGDQKCPVIMNNPQWGMGMFYDYKALWQAWSRFGEYSRWRGDNLLVWPVHSYDMAHLKTRRLPWGNDPFASGYGYRPIDKYRRDSLKLILLLCEKYEIDFVCDLQINNGGREKIYADLIAKTENATPEQCKDPLLEFGRQYPATVLDPSQPVARSYLVNFYGDIARQYGSCKALKGVNIRQWSWASMVAAWFVNHGVGYGDGTISRFEQATGLKAPPPKDPNDREGTYHDRYDFLVGNPENRQRWFQWRADQVTSLREEILAKVREYAPQMRLFAGFTGQPEISLGQGLDGKRLLANPALGFGAGADYSVTGIEVNSLDPYTYRGFDIRDGVAQPAAEERLASNGYQYPFGMCSGSGLVSPPNMLKPLALALAAAPLDQLLQGGLWVLPLTDDALRAWVQTWRAIPALAYERLGARDVPVVCWQALNRRKDRVAYFVNTTAAPQTVKVAFDTKRGAVQDLVSGAAIGAKDGVLELTVASYGLRLLQQTGKAKVASVVPAVTKPPPAATDRVKFVVANPEALARENEIVVVPGAKLLDATAATGRIEVPVIRVYADDKPLPCQVDEKDGTGEYVENPNRVLDADDEICFQLSFKAGETSRPIEVRLEPGAPAASWPSPFETATTTGPTPEQPYDLRVSNGTIDTGFLKQEKKAASAGLSYLAADGVPLFRGVARNRSNYSALMPLGWAGQATDPRVLAAGPVRVLVGIFFPQRADVEWLFERERNSTFKDGYLKAAAVSRVYQVGANSPIVRLRDRYTYDRALIPNFHTTTPYQRLVDFGGTPEEKVLHYADVGELKSVRWQQPGGFGLGGATSDNWLAVWDDSVKHGLEIVTLPKLNYLQCSDTLMIRYSNAAIPEHELVIDKWVIALRNGAAETAARLNAVVLNPLTLQSAR